MPCNTHVLELLMHIMHFLKAIFPLSENTFCHGMAQNFSFKHSYCRSSGRARSHSLWASAHEGTQFVSAPHLQWTGLLHAASYFAPFSSTALVSEGVFVRWMRESRSGAPPCQFVTRREYDCTKTSLPKTCMLSCLPESCCSACLILVVSSSLCAELILPSIHCKATWSRIGIIDRAKV